MEQVLSHYMGSLQIHQRRCDSLNGAMSIHKGENPRNFGASSQKYLELLLEMQTGAPVLGSFRGWRDVSIHASALKAIEWFQLDTEAVARKCSDDAEESEHSEPLIKPAPARPEKPENKEDPKEDASASKQPQIFVWGKA